MPRCDRSGERERDEVRKDERNKDISIRFEHVMCTPISRMVQSAHDLSILTDQ